jgi:hypothetical protein
LYKTKENSISKGFLQDINKTKKTLGVLLDDFGNNQIAFDAAWGINSYLPNETGVLIFSQDWCRPIVTPPTAVYHSYHLYGHRGDIVCFTPQSVDDCLRCGTVGKIIWYMYNPHEVNACFPEFINNIMSNERVIKVCRAENHKKLIKNLFPMATIEEETVPVFDIEKLLRIIDGL